MLEHKTYIWSSELKVTHLLRIIEWFHKSSKWRENKCHVIVHASFDKMPNIKQRNYNLQAEHKVAQVDKVASGKKGHVTDCVSCARLSNILKQWKIT